MKLNRKWLAAGVVLAVIVLPVLIKSVRGEARTEVTAVEAGEQEINPTILASGVISYLTEVNLTAEVVAKVDEILVEEGDQVEAGQLLLRLDPETYRNALEREQASRRQSLINIERQRLALALADKKLERGARLLERQMIGQEQYDELRNARDLARVELQGSEEALRRAEAVLGEVREQLAKTDIRAPIAGTIVSLPIKVGETAIPSTNALAGSVLMTIADTSAIEARMKVDEADIARIRVGQKADVFAAAFQDTAVPGVVQQIALAPTVEAQGRAYEVKILLDVPEGLALRSGMSARADIYLGDGGRSLAVPVEAIVVEEDEERQVRRHVWVLQDGQAAKREIEVGLSDDRWEAVTSGLEAGELVITGPAKSLRTLREGDAVEVADKAAAGGVEAASE
ncbi:MAG TPA: efflux RND transporter periplasmic adaptor subunit [Arenimonas sp.]|nr:efflux RND transporter periplasmic adaptor subunit [Arenimonas sp.]